MKNKLCKLFVKTLNALTVTLFCGFFLVIFTALLLSWVLALSGCCAGEDADLVVVNDSGRDVYSIAVEYAGSTETVTAASGRPLLEPGQTFGLTLEEDEATVVLLDMAQRVISRNRVTRVEGQRMFLTVDGVTEGRLNVDERPHG